MSDSTKNHLEHLGFVRIEPSATLKTFIDCYWFIDAKCRGLQGYNEYLHPDGGMGFIFNYGDSLALNGNNNFSDAFLDGTNTKSINLVLTENIKALGIRFKPAGAAAFFDMPLDELKNQQLELNDLNIKLYSQLYEQLAEQKSLVASVSIIESTLNRIRTPELIISKRITNAIKRIQESNGRCLINSLSQDLNISQRKLERLFKSQMGMSAIEYTKTVRAEHARTMLKVSNLPLAEVAYKLGYFDQAHFTRSFKSVVGITPGQYRMNSQALT